jgi:rare lipoprotein A
MRHASRTVSGVIALITALTVVLPAARVDAHRRTVEVPLKGVASWYGDAHHGRRTASGEVFDQEALTAAHPSLPFGTVVRVTNVRNGKAVTVRVNDRGPVITGRIIDLSRAAARAIGSIASGVVPVRLEIVRRSSPPPTRIADSRR